MSRRISDKNIFCTNHILFHGIAFKDTPRIIRQVSSSSMALYLAAFVSRADVSFGLTKEDNILLSDFHSPIEQFSPLLVEASILFGCFQLDMSAG